MVSSTIPNSPDPAIPVDDYAESMPDMDFASHVRTFNRVLATAKWFIIHLAIIIVALYFAVIQGSPVVGGVLILCSIALLVFGALRRSPIRDDMAEGLAAGPTASAQAVRDQRDTV